MAKQQGADFDSVKTNNRAERIRPSDKVNIMKLPAKKWVTLRLFGPTFSYCTYWVKTKKKDGKGTTNFSVNSPSYSPDTQEFDSTKYDPWRDLYQAERGVDQKDRNIQVATHFYINAIMRSEQKKEPARKSKPTSSERKTGYKDKDSDTWTPVVALRLPAGVVAKIQKMKGLNTVDGKGGTKSYSLSHPKFGMDIRIMHDPDESPANQYTIQPGPNGQTPLTEEELAYLKWDLSELASEQTEEEVKADFASWAKRNGIKLKGGKKRSDEDFEEEDEDEAPKSKKGKAAKKPARDEDEDEDFDDDDGDDEDEDDEPPAKKGKKAPAKSKRKADEDDEDEDDDSEDDDEDDEDSDSDDEDDDDFDDEDDEPKKGKGKPAKKGGKSAPWSDDEDDEDGDDDADDEDEDEDEDDEPKAKRKAPAKKTTKPAKKTSKKPVDEDDDDDFGDDDDEDEDEEEEAPKAKKGKSKPAAKKSSKKRPADEDDDDDFGDDDE
ncbi:hypothetical protein [Ralstonia phage phiRSL1]|uniref:SsDNA binding protein n=1 Tax=Ralstonia phage phiRSL1 TaxID=1980924 RepID=B2ZYC2_9CAUD|nr:single strand DNA binding protein [Ralstonia phage phiRSL1]BAG41672.1 hypothetical protein [Ralstonia phage phiRSL1]